MEKHEVRYLIIGGTSAHFIAKADLVASKIASGRTQDLRDVESIRKSGKD